MEYAITDFRLAGFLLSRDVTFIKAEMGEEGEVFFIFDNTDNIAIKTLNLYPSSQEQRYDSSCKTMHNFVKALKRGKHK